jgi:glycine cleavage system H protein
MTVPKDRLYSEDHLWVKLDSSQAIIGLTTHAVEELGQIDYLDLPELDMEIARTSQFGTVETSKAVTELVAPLSGMVIAVNDAAIESPDFIAGDPYASGWLIRITPSDQREIDTLLKPQEYEDLLEGIVAVVAAEES